MNELFDILNEMTKVNTIWLELVRKTREECEKKDKEIIMWLELVRKTREECEKKNEEIIELKRKISELES